MPLCGAKDEHSSFFHSSCQWGLTKTIWLVLNKKLWKFRIRSFGIGGWIRWTRKLTRRYPKYRLISLMQKWNADAPVFFGFFSVKLLVVISNGRWRCFRLIFFSSFSLHLFQPMVLFINLFSFSNLHRMEAASNWQWRDQGNVESLENRKYSWFIKLLNNYW